MIIWTVVKSALKLLRRALFTVAKIVYSLLKLLRIRLLALYLAVCGLCQLFFGVFSGASIVFFWIGFVACAAYTLLGWFFRAREGYRRKSLSKPKKIRVKQESEPRAEQPSVEDKKRTEKEKREQTVAPAYPQYFEVEGHAGYLFAEYADRYELFCRGESGWQYVKTDYKEEV